MSDAVECPACGSSEHSSCCGAGVEEGEICLFGSMPWIHDVIGSQMEHQLTLTPPGFCRNNECQKPLGVKDSRWPRPLTAKNIKPEVSWCSPECRKKWEEMRDMRLAIGRHDLRRRGYD